MKTIGTYTLTITVDGNKYKVEDKVKCNKINNNNWRIGLYMKGSPLWTKLHERGELNELCHLFPDAVYYWRTKLKVIGIPNRVKSNNYLFRIIKALDNLTNNSILSFTNQNTRNIFSFSNPHISINKFKKWINDINQQKLYIYEVSKGKLKEKGYVTINIEIDEGKIIAIAI